ncbi:MAG: imidazole glycerol phosphate synthase subunit HisH [Cyclobacteriaceae bacterium]
MITIIDYSVGNLASVQNMLKKCGIESRVTSDPEKIRQADKLILPGVGAFDAAMQKINERGLQDAIQEASKKGTFILGICLGAQLLLEASEEGNLSGLSLIPGKCKKFDAQQIAPLRVPHMGWSEVSFLTNNPITKFEEQPRFYFTHSFYINCHNPANRLAVSFYGHEFTCGVICENVMGLQFHPEKSHKFGARLFTNFAAM